MHSKRVACGDEKVKKGDMLDISTAHFYTNNTPSFLGNLPHRQHEKKTRVNTIEIYIILHKMPPSQLKRLKASLREQGIVGPQQSKKQKKQNAQNGASKEKRVHRAAALSGIREQFNPFEYKTSARGPKFDVTTNRTLGGRITKSVKARPGVAKSLGEEKVGYPTIFIILCLTGF